VSSEVGNSDWHYRFKHRLTVGHGLGIWYETNNLKDAPRPPLENRVHEYKSPYYLYDLKPKDIHCHVMLYASDTTESKPRTRRLRFIYVDLEGCDRGECSFKASASGGKVPEDGTGQFCGEYSDVGAPLSCKLSKITHVVTKVMGDGKCSDRVFYDIGTPVDSTRYANRVMVEVVGCWLVRFCSVGRWRGANNIEQPMRINDPESSSCAHSSCSNPS
jgi:hypothetical protein